ncbi:unnamed protein product [Tuber aestivum]|uniref:Uncharacterized protein n=1 Tax=Tuber aestivum TaxID=59557 RepID=A0A292Q6W5_9PEZI|nr:unnamed protein product [Tuber aestivum]
MFTYRIARLMLPRQPRAFLPGPGPSRLHTFGLAQPTRMVQLIRFQKYSTDEKAPENGLKNASENSGNASENASENAYENASGNTSGLGNASEIRANRITRVEMSIIRLESGIEGVGKSVAESQTWVRWALGSVLTGVVLKMFYDHHVEEGFNKKLDEMGSGFDKKLQGMESRLKTAILDAITVLKLELKVEHQREREERLLSGQKR